MILIIAEKPSLGRDIAAAIDGSAKTENGCIYKGDYVITWVYGHMLTLKEPEDYDKAYKNWSLGALPIYFDNWQQKIGADTSHRKGQQTKRQRVAQIGELIKRAELVIHAGDPDEEGQLLIDELLNWFGYKGEVKRLDTGNTTAAALKKALKNMRDNRLFESQGVSAFARSVADMTVGVNMSRFFTLKNNKTLLAVGRVQTPTLGLVVNRDSIIENHVKMPYFVITADAQINGKTIPVKFVQSPDDTAGITDGKITDKEKAYKIANALKGFELHNIEITKEKISEPPPLPFNLVKLQTYCGSHFGYSPQEVISITQSLRENHKAITYNRSDCQYLSEEHYKEAPKTIETVVSNISYRPALLDTKIKSRCFNDSNITAHFAIIPTDNRVNLDKLSERERNVYLAVCKYYLAQFLPNAQKERTRLSCMIGKKGAKLTAVSTAVISAGYLTIFRDAKKDDVSALSKLDGGIYDGIVTDSHVDEKETKPPARYTKATLNEDMTCIAKYVDDPQIKRMLLDKDKDKKGENGSIGTSATRGIIIDGLIQKGYLREENRRVISTELGRELYRILPDEIKKADMTARWWVIQEDIRAGKADYTALTENVLETVKEILKKDYPKVDPQIISDAKAARKTRTGKSYAAFGKCPRCGGRVVENSAAFSCVNRVSKGCGFTIWKKNRLPWLSECTFTKTAVKNLLSGKAVKMNKLKSKNGALFSAEIIMRDDPKSPYGPSFEIKK